MHMHWSVRTSLTISASVLVACAPGETKKTDTVVADAATAKVTTQAGEVMGTRQEAQAYADSAMMSFTAKRDADAAKFIRAAAGFTRDQSDGATEPAKAALIASANELSDVAARVEQGQVSTKGSLRYVCARMHLAEAQLHCTQALDAWKQAQPGATSAEMVMLADHFERAAADAAQPLDAATRKSLSTARELAAKLANGVAVPTADVDPVLTALDTQLHALMKQVAVLK